MLTQLTINNFAIVDQLVIDFNKGMTAITGETGAGKSIAIDALGLCLGERSDANFIRYGADRVDISAYFQLDDTPSALTWLQNNQLDDEKECILRRVINQDGRSKAFINGRPVPVSQLKEIGQMLIQIHGQHEHQLLLRNEHQQQLLDQYIAEHQLTSKMKQAYKAWKTATEQYQAYEQNRKEQESHIQLLQYQLKELNEFSPINGEYEQIDEEYKKLANSEQLIGLSQKLIDLLEENPEFNIISNLNNAQHTLSELAGLDASLTNLLTMLEEATIQIKETSYELHHYADHIEIDPSRVMQLEQRLSKQIALARKHHIAPENLPQFHQQLLEEFKQIANIDELADSLKIQVENAHQNSIKIAQQLHEKRIKSAKILSEKITKSIQELSMPHGQFEIEINWNEQKVNESGGDQITFLVTTNPGQPLQPINKVASGGELSRIALAIQVITAQKMETPALIFDEIDVGISGPTAAKVGQLLSELGLSTQVITVTHLPQVAGSAHHHYFVTKQTDGQNTQTTMQILTEKQRIHELARLLGGDKITENTLANAKELLMKNN